MGRPALPARRCCLPGGDGTQRTTTPDGRLGRDLCRRSLRRTRPHDPKPVVSIVIDQAVYEAQLAAITGDGAVAPPDPGDIGRQRCRSTGGIPIDPADAVAASVIGLVRRVVIGAVGVVVDLVRRSRIFTGSTRQAAILQAALDAAGYCAWAGCTHRRCQIDHTLAWSRAGPTTVANSGPLCPDHNRWKTRATTPGTTPTADGTPNDLTAPTSKPPDAISGMAEAIADAGSSTSPR